MFPHEEFLKKALEECQISKLVMDLGGVYVALVGQQSELEWEFEQALKVDQILKEAAGKIADLGAKPKIQHPMDAK